MTTLFWLPKEYLIGLEGWQLLKKHMWGDVRKME